MKIPDSMREATFYSAASTSQWLESRANLMLNTLWLYIRCWRWCWHYVVGILNKEEHISSILTPFFFFFQSDGEMFTATQYEFRSSPDVRRNFPFPTLRTEEAPTQWLLGKRRIMDNLCKRMLSVSLTKTSFQSSYTFSFQGNTVSETEFGLVCFTGVQRPILWAQCC